jgi:undecaprenyl-diphosphatase
MSAPAAIFLGFIQGLSEFLPVSSSGHLVIIQKLVPGFSQPGVLFDVVLHAGTLFAVLIYFRKDILKMSLKYLLLLVIGTIPAVIVGFLFQKPLEALFSDAFLVGVALLITGVLDIQTDSNQTTQSRITQADSALIGISQAFAIIPGISRSGSTIFTGTMLGIEKSKAAKFSFLLSVPAVVGANLLEILSHPSLDEVNFGVYFLGFLTAMFIGYLAIGLVFRLLGSAKFKYFGYYCLILGIITLVIA